MTDHGSIDARLAATLGGVLYVAQALANYRDSVEGGTHWRKALEADLVAKAKNTSLQNVPLASETALYEAMFAGITLALLESKDGKPPSISFE